MLWGARTVEEDAAERGVVEPLQQPDHRGLARAGAPDQGGGFAPAEHKVDRHQGEGVICRRVRERHAFELERAVSSRLGHRRAAVCVVGVKRCQRVDLALAVDDVEDEALNGHSSSATAAVAFSIGIAAVSLPCAEDAFAMSGSWPTAPIVLKVADMMLWSARMMSPPVMLPMAPRWEP